MKQVRNCQFSCLLATEGLGRGQGGSEAAAATTKKTINAMEN